MRTRTHPYACPEHVAIGRAPIRWAAMPAPPVWDTTIVVPSCADTWFLNIFSSTSTAYCMQIIESHQIQFFEKGMPPVSPRTPPRHPPWILTQHNTTQPCFHNRLRPHTHQPRGRGGHLRRPTP